MTPTEPYPFVLMRQVRVAAQLAHTITIFASRLQPGDPSFTWTLGREDEVRALVSAVTREWSDGILDADTAANRLADYIRGITASLGARIRASKSAPRRVAFRPVCDTLSDA
jgi:hypothetical protein